MISGEVGAGKTVGVRAALAQLEPSRHQIIYIPDPTITMRGIHTQIVTALGGTPAFYSGVLASQTPVLLAGELDERARLPVVVTMKHTCSPTPTWKRCACSPTPTWTPAHTSRCS